MQVLGVHGNFGRSEHDPAAALVVDGYVVAAAEEERFLRQRHAVGLMPEHAIRFCLDTAGIALRDVDALAFPRATWVGFEERLQAYLCYRFGCCPPIRFVHHHLAHAASAFYPTGFDQALVVTIDQAGDGVALAVYRAAGKGLTRVHAEPYPNSLGLYAAMLTQFLGFRSNHDEYKVMGLAAHGTSTVDLDGILDVAADGYCLNQELLHREARRVFPEFHVEQLPLFNQALTDRLGTPRRCNEPIQPGHFDLAASVQRRLEDAVLAVVNRHRQPSDRRLCLAGGVAHNSVLNGRLARTGWFDELYVAPAAGDAGTALGAALQAAADAGDRPQPCHTSQLGPSVSDASIAETLARAGVHYRQVDDPAALAAELLAAGRLVGWFQGSAEYGPRALGARSLLANPTPAETKQRLDTVKRREAFRPFAPALLDEFGGELIESYRPSPFMSLTLPTTPLGGRLLAAAIHVDGSARYQTVTSGDDAGLFRRLLEAFHDLTGVPAVLNTSLNAGWEPIVLWPEDAMAFFTSSGLDALLMGSFVLERGR
jgi:carbamoyltransferase